MPAPVSAPVVMGPSDLGGVGCGEAQEEADPCERRSLPKHLPSCDLALPWRHHSEGDHSSVKHGTPQPMRPLRP